MITKREAEAVRDKLHAPEYARGLARAYLDAMDDVAMAVGVYFVRCRLHKPLRSPLCADCQADARIEEMAERFRAFAGSATQSKNARQHKAGKLRR